MSVLSDGSTEYSDKPTNSRSGTIEVPTTTSGTTGGVRVKIQVKTMANHTSQPISKPQTACCGRRKAGLYKTRIGPHLSHRRLPLINCIAPHGGSLPCAVDKQTYDAKNLSLLYAKVSPRIFRVRRRARQRKRLRSKTMPPQVRRHLRSSTVLVRGKYIRWPMSRSE